jgi:hypothetical protein
MIAEDNDADIIEVSVTPSVSATSASKRSNRSSSPLGPASKKSKTTASVAVELLASKIPELRAGAEVNHKRPKASDYEDVVEALILRAAFEYESLISTVNAFPGTTLRHKWANQAWKNAGLDADENYKLTDRISSLVRCHLLYSDHTNCLTWIATQTWITYTWSCFGPYSPPRGQHLRF